MFLSSKKISTIVTLTQTILIVLNLKLYLIFSIVKIALDLYLDPTKQHVANITSLFRLCCCGFFFVESFLHIAIFINILFDILDGFLARRFKLTTQYGHYLDAYCDTVFHNIAFIVFGYIIFPNLFFIGYSYPLILILVQFLDKKNVFQSSKHSIYSKYFAQLFNLLFILLCVKASLPIIAIIMIFFIYNFISSPKNETIYTIIQLFAFISCIFLTPNIRYLFLLFCGFSNLLLNLYYIRVLTQSKCSQS